MRVRVLGAGVVGLACADELVRRGHEVEVVDPAPGGGASYAAAGMLAPTAEVWHAVEALLDLGLRSLALWPAAARRWGVALRTGGTLLVGRDDADLQQVERQAALLARLGRSVDVVGGRAARSLEPRLGTGIAGAALLPDEGSVAPRAVVAALLDRHRARLLPAPSAAPADRTVVATGIAATGLVRGVRGEILRLRSDDPPERTVRGWVHGEPVYVVPRADGEVVVGATSEEHDAPPVVTAGGVRRLLDAACRLLPGLDRAELLEATARDRPATADNLPLVGPAGPRWSAGRTDGAHAAGTGGRESEGARDTATVGDRGPDGDTVLAVGLFRHGVLLAPLVAALVADHLDHGHVEPALDPRRLEPPAPPRSHPAHPPHPHPDGDRP
ncbi:FAD-dependent oxidoreductase [Nocardioides kribbensis]|uniref:FAD-dependent oxidoreductase n=1 Tax=Nocardioides kribbensis TaxID=305517 RepID=UPI0032D9B562